MNQFTMGPVGQISRRVSDIEAAVEWYSDVLGFALLYRFGELAFFDLGGLRLFLSAGERETDVRGESVIYFRVDDIHATYALLTERGVSFIGAPHLIYQHETGVEEWMAFFRDPDGQTLAIMSQVRGDGNVHAAIAPELPRRTAR
ncbi:MULTISPECIES: VOC family protein [unclassified Leucobacter]|uniref:VOC family protein n=1 Tax=unclassified Leucobacter TaxID=2621730 RepID=UPI00165E7834|nr:MULTISPECIES: VOC family protein [unclassified Leucobacter]MBC9935935.1 VOC family protein [Leucobacter sp. cx-87]